MLERLQKIISAAGVTSRRAAEELIASGRVRVNGQVVTELGSKADASKDHIKVDGKLINPKQPMTYIMLNKPAGYVTTMSDPEGRPTVQDLMKGVKARVYPVGRLDYNTEGMLIMTNDGDFAHLVTHPRHELPKTYLAKVKGVLDDKAIESLEIGVYLDDGKTAPAKVKKVRKEEANSWIEITIHEGRKRQVRRMLDRVGRSVIKLKRIKTGSLLLGDLPEGSFRYLTLEEVQGLKEMAQSTEPKMPVTREEGRQWGEEKRREATEKRRETREERRGTTEKRREPRENQRETSARSPKTAHKGRKPDMRPWKVAERAEEYRREATERREPRDERRGTTERRWGAGSTGQGQGRTRDERRRWSEGGRRETTGKRGRTRDERSGTTERRREPRENRRETSAGGPKTAHKGRNLDIRPWNVAGRAEEYRRETTERRRGTRNQERETGGARQGARHEGSRWSIGDRRGKTEKRREAPREIQLNTRNDERRTGFGSRTGRRSRPTDSGKAKSRWHGSRPSGTKKRR